MEPSVTAARHVDDERPVVGPLDPARWGIWIILLILGGLQAWAARFNATPDGISYIDLSDGVVTGHPGDIVNAYWSPLYPVLLGVLRLILRPGAYWEFAVIHLLNLLLFAASIAAFEYFLQSLTRVAVRRGRPELTTTSGRIIAYVIFGMLSLLMTPLALPTPDLLLTSASFVAFGSLLRLRDEPTLPGHAIVLGLALAMGSLAKSFFIPWSVIVLVVTWAATRRQAGWRPTARAIAVWLVFVGPWCTILSVTQGRLTIGDTGRLTYIWFVNQNESPSAKIMPHGAETPASRAALPAVAVTEAARGTNPVWFDPARWYTGLSPHWDFARQMTTFSNDVGQFFASFSPILLVVCFALAVARREARRAWWLDMWIIIVPALIAMGAYSLVLVTTRYLAPFVIMLIIVVWLALPWPSRLTPARVLIGLGIPLLILVATPRVGVILSLDDAALVAVIVAWAVRRRGSRLMALAGVIAALASYVLMPASLRSFFVIGTVLIVVCFWIASRQAIRNHEARRFSAALRRDLVIANGLIIVYVAGLKYSASVTSPTIIAGDANANWLQAEVMRRAGFGPGSKIAIVGSPFEAYWARTARMQIVAVVPPWRVPAFMGLSVATRDRLLGEFARAGARGVVSLTPLSPVTGDTSWVPYDYIGWIKRLPAR